MDWWLWLIIGIAYVGIVIAAKKTNASTFFGDRPFMRWLEAIFWPIPVIIIITILMVMSVLVVVMLILSPFRHSKRKNHFDLLTEEAYKKWQDDQGWN